MAGQASMAAEKSHDVASLETFIEQLAAIRRLAAAGFAPKEVARLIALRDRLRQS